ncbi:MAG: polysaccharide biosynthesis tyrosine autokinase [Chloroflexi bacterium]|nr:polysaccharide biosynthesis tyrosine autokinase [Chloroflexota bacterium]
MEISAYLAILWRRKWIIAITTIGTVIVAAIGTMAITPKYTTTTTLRVAANGSSVSYGDLLYSQRLMNTYPAIVTSGPVQTQVEEQLGLDDWPKIKVEFPADSELMQIVVTGDSPHMLAEVANTLAEILIAENKKTKIGRSFTISLIDPATTPNSPTGPDTVLYLVLGAVLGITGGLGLAFLFENLDTRLYTSQQIETVSKLPVLALIPSVKKGQAAFMNGNSAQGEAFRRLRTNIFASNQEGVQTILVTSAEPGEGKSTTTANLALAIAQAGQSVVVVDSDLRRPTLHKVFKLSNQMGLSTLLEQKAKLAEAMQNSKAGVKVLTSGPRPSNPAELLASPEMTALIEQLRQQFEVVLLDTSALLAVIDAAVIVPTADHVLLVVGQAQIRQEDLEAVCRQLTLSRAKSISLAVNKSGPDSRYGYYYRDD